MNLLDGFHFPELITSSRKEVHTRSTFAYEQAVKYLKAMQFAVRGGNVLTCKSTMKFLQARRGYIHYTNEFQTTQKLPQSI